MKLIGKLANWFLAFTLATCALPIAANAQQNITPNPSHPKPVKFEPLPATFANGFRFNFNCGVGRTPATIARFFGDLKEGPSENGRVCSSQISHTVIPSGRLELVLGYENMSTTGTGIYTPNDVQQLLPPGILSQKTNGTETISDKAWGLGVNYNPVNRKNYLVTISPKAYYHFARASFTGQTNVVALSDDGISTQQFAEPSTDFRKMRGWRAGVAGSFTRMFGDIGVTPVGELGPSSFWKVALGVTFTPGRSARFKRQ